MWKWYIIWCWGVAFLGRWGRLQEFILHAIPITHCWLHYFSILVCNQMTFYNLIMHTVVFSWRLLWKLIIICLHCFFRCDRLKILKFGQGFCHCAKLGVFNEKINASFCILRHPTYLLIFKLCRFFLTMQWFWYIGFCLKIAYQV